MRSLCRSVANRMADPSRFPFLQYRKQRLSYTLPMALQTRSTSESGGGPAILSTRLEECRSSGHGGRHPFTTSAAGSSALGGGQRESDQAKHAPDPEPGRKRRAS